MRNFAPTTVALALLLTLSAAPALAGGKSATIHVTMSVPSGCEVQSVQTVPAGGYDVTLDCVAGSVAWVSVGKQTHETTGEAQTRSVHFTGPLPALDVVQISY